jgi:GH18 family chitinase
MAYDYHGSWNKETGHNSPLFGRADQTGDQSLLNQVKINLKIESQLLYFSFFFKGSLNRCMD